ncbi:hypothetical protein FIBSPDRAFT_1054348 [Athelia psychrophila]|uniref:DNA polymerase alpha/delta/epsilon subunit B domain-containing protein n=1 Tax=Athelia psychrophila TaxID=1759441 RepID=A0A167VFL9_9AGAM|nr:hypothetical protein FIBSPDRAFT_1054348 [Fibularhizoctonia sp. CBS 109695]
MAPTAPDTLWCHPFLDRDPFLIAERPDVYVVGCQPAFATRFVRDGEGGGEDGEGAGGGGKKKRKGDGKEKAQGDGNGDGDGGEGTDGTRVILLPSFALTGVLVLLNLRTLRVRRVKFGVRGIRAGGGDGAGDMEC